MNPRFLSRKIIPTVLSFTRDFVSAITRMSSNRNYHPQTKRSKDGHCLSGDLGKDPRCIQ